MTDTQIHGDAQRNIPEKSLKLLQTTSRISDTLALLDSSDLKLGSNGKSVEGKHTSTQNAKEYAAANEPRSASDKIPNSLGLKDQESANLSKPEVQRETTTIYKYSHSGDQKENVDVAFLMNRIAALESKTLQPPEDQSLKLKLEALRHQNHEIHSKSAKQELEIKALLDQNDILRKEHRRMQEVESSLRLRLVESHPTANNPSKLDVGDQVNQERILQKLEELIGQIVSAESHVHDNTSNSKHILIYRNVLLACKKIVKTASDTSPGNILNLCKSITEVIEVSFDHVWEIIKESQGLDAKIDRLRQESLVVNQDATQTIKAMAKRHEEEVGLFQHTKTKLQQQLIGLTEKYQQLKEQYRAVEFENQKFGSQPELKPEVVVLPSPASAGIESQLENLQRRNNELYSHIDNLNATIKGWKEENESLQKDFSILKKEKTELERERLTSIQELGDLELKVQDEKLKSQKTAEIVKSLQKTLEERNEVARDERTTDSIGHIFEQQLEAIKAQFAQPSNNGNTDQSDERIIKVIRDLDSKTRKIQELQNLARGKTALISEQERTLEKLGHENERNKEKLISSKDKFQVKEISWLERIKKTKLELESTVKELQEAKQYLHGYHDQWLAINALCKESPGKDGHPFEFGVLFNKLYSRTSDVADKCGELEKQLNETRTAFDTTSKELLLQVKQYETLGSESKNTKTSLLDIVSEKSKLEVQLKDLQCKLDAALEAKREANEKLKTVTTRVIEYVNEDMLLSI